MSLREKPRASLSVCSSRNLMAIDDDAGRVVRPKASPVSEPLAPTQLDATRRGSPHEREPPRAT